MHVLAIAGEPLVHAGALLTARAKPDFLYESARTAEARLPKNDGSDFTKRTN